MKEKFLKFKSKCVEKIDKLKEKVTPIKEKVEKKCTKVNAVCAGAIATIMASPLGVFANITPESVSIKTNADATSAMNNLVGLMITISRYLGVIIIVIGAVQWALALKDENPDGQSRAVKVILAGIVTFSIKFVLQGIGVI